jgi:uncharacterized protein YdiU (UPF0061 family)
VLTSLNTAPLGWNFNNSYTQLPASFYTKLPPTPVRAPTIVILNHELAELLGLKLHDLSDDHAAQLFSGNIIPDGAAPLAQAYAGHQFGHFAMLGDGRAVVLGEHITPDGSRMDIQLKGSGQTPYSRRGDGRAALAPMLREYIISEAMHALGVPTTRSLAVTTTGEPVFRERGPLPGAVLTRVADSHIRVGTFEYVAHREDIEGIKRLADYTIARHYPQVAESDQPYCAFLHAVMERQALLVAQWLHVGFIHGVMNSDNMAISGETIDYGPCAFMDAYNPATVFSSIDRNGRYSYSNQSYIAQWNLARFAETLLPLLDTDIKKSTSIAEDAIESFGDIFQRHWLAGMRKKLGLFGEESEDIKLVGSLLEWMQRNDVDYTNSFRTLALESILDQPAFQDREFLDWQTSWQARLARNSKPLRSSHCLMRANNPAIIPRNHRVEAALTAASEQGDYSLIRSLLEALKNPYDDVSEYADYKSPPPPDEDVYKTFCGT